VVLAGKHPDKLSIARDQGLPTITATDLALNRVFDVVVDATGASDGLESALNYVKPRGTIILKTTVAERAAVDLARIVVDEVRIVGSRCGPFEPALRVLSARRIRVGPLISGIYGFARAQEAFSRAQEEGSLKVLIDFSK
jgi:threonine dehydrogenase-like Zn-dependent dehydrogenase